ncbi:sensor histidine kinase [Candidatus Stoquefichus massiliensis]|uniref:sensor histidine kinase n=1 Tax=Candidatus Stoquefichus massiliensis TaxID=1470350 RepID=UPI0004AF5263|nr:GHKL domain-containing protein [Candidatus Stoquefichus massiliensis]
MIRYLLWGFYQFVDISLYIILAFAIFENDMKKGVKNYLFLAIIFLLFCFFGKLISIDILILAPFVILFLATQAKLLKRVWITFSTISFILMIQQFVSLIINPQIFLTSQMNSFGVINAYMGISILIVAGIIKFIKMRKMNDFHFDDIPSYLYMNIILGLCAGVFPLTIINYLGKELLGRLYYLIMFVSYLGLICTTITVILFIKNFQEKNKYFDESQLKDELLMMQNEYYDETVKNYEYIRSFKHDIKGHLRTLLHLEKTQNYNELHDYLIELQDTIQEYGIFQCSNIYIAAVLNSFQKTIEDKQIQLNIQYFVNGNIEVESIDICSLFHNLLSNAIEEEMKVNDFSREISITIMNFENHLKIEIINHVTKEFNIDNIEQMKTTKSNYRDHGIGLKNIQNIINKYHGRMTYEYNKRQLTMVIILQDVVK